MVRHSARNLRGLQRGEAGVVSAPEEKAPSNQSVKKDDKPTPLVLRVKGDANPDDPSYQRDYSSSHPNRAAKACQGSQSKRVH